MIRSTKNRWRGVIAVMWLCVCAFTTIASAQETPQTAEEIIEKSLQFNIFGFQNGQAAISLIAYDRAGERQIRKLDIKSKYINGNMHTLVSLVAPREVQGQAFLLVENTGDTDDIWMYVPSFGVTKRIEENQKRSAFLGTHFSFADLQNRDLRRARYKRLKDDKIGTDNVYVIESTPTQAALSDYQKIISDIRKTDYRPLRIRYYDKNGQLDKTLIVEDNNPDTSDNKYLKKITLRANNGGYTAIIIDALNVDDTLSDTVFSRDNLGK